MRQVLEDGVRSVKLVRVSRNVMRIENLLNPLPSSYRDTTTSCLPSDSQNTNFSGLDALATAAAGCTRIPPRIISVAYNTCTSMAPRIAQRDQTVCLPLLPIVNATRYRSNTCEEIQTNLADPKRHKNLVYRDTRIFICRVPSCRKRSLGIYQAEQHDKKAHNPKDHFVKHDAKIERQKAKELKRKTLRFMPGWTRHALKGSAAAMKDAETGETVTGTSTVDSGNTVQAPYEMAKRVKPGLPFILWDQGRTNTKDCPGGPIFRWKITI